jgi:hypothetical protein
MLNVLMLNVLMLNVVMLNVVMLNVIMLSAVILGVVAPKINLTLGTQSNIFPLLSRMPNKYYLN